MLQNLWTGFIGLVASANEVLKDILAFNDSNPVAFHVLALMVAVPFFLVSLINSLIWFFKCRKNESEV